jgi:ABC-2 type transport system ATP-binding protein
MHGDAVVLDDVEVRYGPVLALRVPHLAVAPAATVAVLGHNGAGKTTLIRVMTTMTRPTRGGVTVHGVDAVTDPDRVRRMIGVTGQYAGLDDFLTTVENLELVGRLAGLRRFAGHRAVELVERFGLTDLAGRRVGELSGGSRRRVDLAASLVSSPKVLFLDEPTTGLDPTARQALWAVVDELTLGGTTVVLTTQYLEEADRLADRVVVLDHGRIAADGSPRQLKAIIGERVVRATIPANRMDDLPQRPDAAEPLEQGQLRVSFTLAEAAELAPLVAALAARGELADLDVSSPSLDDVFFHLATNGAAR